jgi:hypothetical protein
MGNVMIDSIPQLLSVYVLYPGVVFLLLAGSIHSLLTEGTNQTMTCWRSTIAPPVWWSVEGMLFVLSVLLAAGGLVFLPLPLHPAPPDPMGWLLAWGCLEGAFLLPLLPALLAGSPLIVRAASREAQMGAIGRALLWMVLAVGLLLQSRGNDFGGGQWPVVHLLAIAAAIFALPVAIGWGPFATETCLTPGGSRQGLPREIYAFARFARNICTAALVLASLTILLPLPHGWAGLLLLLVGFVGCSLLLRFLSGRWPRLPLPDALRLSWWRVFPLSLVAIIFLILAM